MVTAFEAGTTRMELANRYGIGRTGVAKLLDSGVSRMLKQIRVRSCKQLLTRTTLVAVFQFARIDTLLRIKPVSIPNASASPARSPLLDVFPHL